MLDWEDLAIDDEGEVEDENAPVPGQEGLFGHDDLFRVARQHWDGMPEFVQEDQQPSSTLLVKFQTPEDRERFAELIGQPTRGWRSGAGIWFPPIQIGHYFDKRYRDASTSSTLNERKEEA